MCQTPPPLLYMNAAAVLVKYYVPKVMTMSIPDAFSTPFSQVKNLPIPAYQTPKQKRRIAKTSLVCVDCVSVISAYQSLQKSMAQAEFDEVILFTDESWNFHDLAEIIAPARVVFIPKITSLAEYSHFMMKQLFHHVSSEFVLVTQWDGHILDGSLWSPIFHQYDYIGAVWPFYPPDDRFRVGNGGFSLRSRRLLAALQDERFVTGQLEDDLICRQYRSILENEFDIVFADPEIAARFSIEHAPRRAASFGFHGLFNFPWALGAEETARILALMPRHNVLGQVSGDRPTANISDAEIGLLLHYFMRGDKAGLATMRRAVLRDDDMSPDELAKLFAMLIPSPSVCQALVRSMGQPISA